MLAASNQTRCRPRVLFLTCHLPWPALSGGRRRELELLSRLAEQFDIHLIAVSKTPREDRANAAALAPLCAAVEVFAAGEPSTGIVPQQVRRHHCAQAGHRVREILAQGLADLVHAEGFYLMQHLPTPIRRPLLLVEQNIEYELVRQRASVESPVTRLDRFVEVAHTKLIERECWQRASSLGAVTAEDRDLIASSCPRKRVHLIPDGADHVPSAAEGSPRRVDRPLIVCVANFAYAPNVDAAIHFCTTILPAVRETVGDAELWLVGNAPPVEVRALASDHVSVTGRVDDVVPYLDAADVVVCPLRIGGGIKVKMIEALRRGKAIVSTSIGAQGLPSAAADAMVVADEPQRFADAVSALIRERARRELLAARARRAAGALPNWDDAAMALTSAYEELLDRSVSEHATASAGGSI